MHIEELNEEGLLLEGGELEESGDSGEGTIIVWDAKRALVGAGARALFYPTLLYNIVRNKIESEFHWWDRVDEFILLGAVPFPADVPRLKELGVSGVVTLNEPYETLVPTSLYYDHDINHLVIPTRDYLFAPSFADICQAVDFIHGNASCGKTTYVHCKAGRGRSTTIVLCYLVKHNPMTPEVAYEHVRSTRPRVLLTSSQWQAVQNYYSRMKEFENDICNSDSSRSRALCLPETQFDELSAFDDGSVVLVTESDLDGYDESEESGLSDKNILAESKLACRFQFASQAAIAKLSCLWVRCQTGQKVLKEELGDSMTSGGQLERVGVDIRVY